MRDLSISELNEMITARHVIEPPVARMAVPYITSEEIERLRAWIAGGASWSPHWSYIPVQRPAIPAVKHPELIRNDIDVIETRVLVAVTQHNRDFVISRAIAEHIILLDRFPSSLPAFPVE